MEIAPKPETLRERPGRRELGWMGCSWLAPCKVLVARLGIWADHGKTAVASSARCFTHERVLLFIASIGKLGHAE